jgi:outer membrane protein assembly factor BamA
MVHLLLLVIAVTASARAMAVDVLLEGNRKLNDRAILNAIGRIACSPADSACADSLCRTVARLYWDRGYLDARVECSPGGEGRKAVRVSIAEGELKSLASVTVAGAHAFSEAALEAMFDDQVRAPFSQNKLEDGISRILELYDTGGYPLTTIQPELVPTDDDHVGVRLRITEGPEARLGGVVFSGADKTSYGALLAETGIAAGQRYDGGKIDRARRRLLDLGVFDSVSMPDVAYNSKDTTVTVSFEVSEARTSIFEGLAAYAPAGDKNRFVGSLDIGFWNLGGTLRRLRVRWNKPGSGRLDWSVYYREPRILSQPFDLEGEVSSDVVDTSYANRRLRAEIVYRGEPGLELGAGVFVGTTKDRTTDGDEGNFGERGLSFNLRYEGRDDVINPRRGQAFTVSHEISSLEFEEDASPDRTVSSLTVKMERLFGLTLRNLLVAGVRFDGVFASAGEVPEAHRIRFGGMESLRGYPEEWFSVVRAVAVRIELRRLVGRASRIYGFFDAAALEDETRSLDRLRDAPFGYGVGLAGGSTSGVVRVEIAVGREDTWNEAKLHFGVLRRF